MPIKPSEQPHYLQADASSPVHGGGIVRAMGGGNHRASGMVLVPQSVNRNGDDFVTAFRIYRSVILGLDIGLLTIDGAVFAGGNGARFG